MRSKLALSAALLASLVATEAAAWPIQVVTDPAGDHPVPAGDIVSADLTTGRSMLAIELEMSGAPSAATPYAYSVSFSVGQCRFSAIYYMNPAVTAPSAAGCRGADGSSQALPEAATSVHGTTIRWLLPLGGALRRGAVARDIVARTAPSGLASGGVLGEAGDVAHGTAPYRIGD